MGGRWLVSPILARKSPGQYELVWASDAGNISGACTSSFPCLPAVFGFSRSGCFTVTGLCTFVDLSWPFIVDLSFLLQLRVTDTKSLQYNFERVVEALPLTILGGHSNHVKNLSFSAWTFVLAKNYFGSFLIFEILLVWDIMTIAFTTVVLNI